MPARHVLYFTGDEQWLYRSVGGALELEGRFTADEAGIAAFRELVQTRKGAVFAVLADLTGEDFHEEQIPAVRGSDREAVLTRRLASRYRDTRLAAAVSLGPAQTTERRNERVLLASFTNTQEFVPWLDALAAAGARLTGVYSVPLLAPVLAARLGAEKARALVVTQTRAGLRQCYLDNGRLRFARLERTGELPPAALAAFVRSETQRLVQYLATLRALPRDGAPLQVLAVAPAGERQAFERELVSDPRLVFRTIDFAEAMQATKLRRAPEGAGAEALFAHLAAAKPPAEQFASREDRRRYFLWQLQRGIVAAGAAGFLACALVGGYRWLDVLGVRGQAQEQAQAARNAAGQYERITATFPVTDTTTENLKVTVIEFQKIAQRTGTPERAMRHVARVLEQFPHFELDALRWLAGRQGELREQALKPRAGEAVPGQNDTTVIVEISGRVQTMQQQDYRGITAQVQRFAASLAGDGYELVRTQLPFDVTPEGVLTGDIGAATESGEAPRFTVVLARRLP